MSTIGAGAEIGASDSTVFASLRKSSPQDRARSMASGREWFRIVNRASSGGTSYAEVYIYDEIGYYGITAGQFVAELGELDVDEIDLHVNSPGGEVWDGIAIYNALLNHRAKVTAYVDGIAASAASLVYMAGDTRVMSEGGQVMIHDAWGLCVGNAADMEAMRARLEAESNNLAGIYHNRAGSSVSAWRKAMLAETWYSADEAVAAGLADRVASKAKRSDDGAAAARWDLSVYGYRYEGRAKAPEPGTPVPAPSAAALPVPPSVTPLYPAPAPVTAGATPPAEPPAPPPAPPAEPEPEPEPEEGLAEVLASMWDPDALRTGIVAAVEGDPLHFDADLFRAAVGHEANNRPAPTPRAPAEPPSPTATEMVELLANGLREAIQ